MQELAGCTAVRPRAQSPWGPWPSYAAPPQQEASRLAHSDAMLLMLLARGRICAVRAQAAVPRPSTAASHADGPRSRWRGRSMRGGRALHLTPLPPPWCTGSRGRAGAASPAWPRHVSPLGCSPGCLRSACLMHQTWGVGPWRACLLVRGGASVVSPCGRHGAPCALRRRTAACRRGAWRSCSWHSLPNAPHRFRTLGCL